MRADQIQRLQELSESLADRFILEAEPAEWPGSGKPPSAWTQQERGDAVWCKKNAIATGGVLRYALDLITKATGGDPDHPPPDDGDADKMIREAERRSKKLVDEALARAKAKPEYDKRVHGK